MELNAEIERENALSVQEIFAIYGGGSRRLEQQALRRLTEHPGPLILATSGGIVAEPLTSVSASPGVHDLVGAARST